MLRLRIGWLSMALMATVLGLEPKAEATTVEAMSLDEMARRAEMIFIGRPLGSRVGWNAERTRIYTYVTLEVERFLKGGGTGEGQVTIRLWGGRIGDVMAVVPGTPTFTPGEEVLLFCAGARARGPTVLGLSLGKFTLATDSTGERILKRDISGLILARHRTGSRQVGAPPVRYRLSEVEARIQRALAQ
ncbi:MAG: hypothetical protein ACE5JI_16705 [Acidobacteriota bacterium]